ncbi:hypothetical protein H2199_000327 [Coniosporium tulheliwenetii]|uniref:Uncharacterized protein n=1 Tax=Coniosporium tulheliwenetii TaxID=3383036 RepID=A0ACC2ZPK3_9PEZI|nr:hypothetical protein H2199_000327 [Cladosporium sp. JES 115]
MEITASDVSRWREDESTSMRPISLERMPQQVEVLASEDDWTGLSNSAARRRLQNRLNQRAYTKRKGDQSQGNRGSTSARANRPAKQRIWCGLGNPANAATYPRGFGADSESTEQSIVRALVVRSVAPISQLDLSKLGRAATICDLEPAETQKLRNQFEEWAYRSYMLGSPTSDLLLTLIQVNVFRAMMSNIFTLGMTGEVMEEEALSPFYTTKLGHLPSSTPPNLCPTTLQRQTPHHPWLDFFPLPVMRDNLLRAGDSFDDVQLCIDLVGFCGAPTGRAGLIVWGEPWDPYGWEVTEGFVKNWGWIVRGCPELFESTNYWRARRGEEQLLFDDVFSESTVS